jgi:ABC-type antimicrobial peptide transport system permease subunit
VSTLRIFITRLKGLFATQRRDEELNEELQSHLEMLVEENRRKGMPQDEARRAASLKFGGIAQTEETYREARGLHFIQTFLQDLRYALRMLRRAPGFATVVVISLALGIGANTAIFSAIDAVMLRMLPVEDPQQLVMLEWHARDWPEKYVGDLEGSSFGNEQEGQSSYSFAYAQYRQFKDQNHVFASAFAFAANSDRGNVGIDGRAEAAVIQGVSGNYFEGLGVQPFAGRMILSEDDQESAPATAVVSHAFWRQRLGGSQEVAGKKIIVNGLPVTILGVTPPDFFGLEPGNSPDLFIPLTKYSAEQARQAGPGSGMSYLTDPKVWWAGIVGRLRPGVTPTQAEAELQVVFDQGLRAISSTPDANKPSLRVAPVKQGLDSLRRQFSSSLLLLMMMVGAVLLIACGNVAALLLTRASARQREIAVRLSLGARRARLVRQLLTESVLLACCGGLLGLVIAKWAGRVLLALLSSGREQIHLELHLDEFYLELQRRIQRIPGVEAVAFSDRNAIGAGASITVGEIPGYVENGQRADIHRHIVGPGYFETLAIPIRVGRPLGAQDTHGSPLAVVVNQEFADKYMHGDNPLGREVVLGGRKQPARYTIVGVAGNVRYGRIREEAPPTAYFAHAQIFAAVGGQLADVNGFSWPFMTYSIKSPQAGQPALLASIRSELTALDKNVPMVDVKTETQVVSEVLFLDRTFAALNSAFGFLALLLACVGLYGTMAYAVARKTNEIGIRMALGAERGAILGMVLRETAAIVLAGIAVGVAASWIARNLLKTRLFGLTPHDPWSIVMSIVATLVVTMIAGYIPARRASRVDPMVALRHE